MDPIRIDTPDLEAAALNAALELRRHRNRCPNCSGSTTGQILPCAWGAILLVEYEGAIRDLGDNFNARGRVARAL